MKYRRFYRQDSYGKKREYVGPLKNLWLNIKRSWVLLIWPPVWGLVVYTVYALIQKGVI